ncbi:hypothetical protein MJL79_29775, partial [Salmonella enterica subsp. enterica serovar Montevideo]|nr:hypothetical protein [Salmonella enterica subsp. enterica serovar Montevideo]
RVADLSADKPLPVAGKAFAGQPYQGEWPAGTCIRIMTGAPVPVFFTVQKGMALKVAVEAIPSLLLIVIIVGGIVQGIFTAIEAS